jgi:NAD(P)-dependent dehydrogenase (short-subunit alcohol dehydrogenase family)
LTSTDGWRWSPAADAAFPFGRVCAPEDVAGVVRFLVSPAAGYVTGEVVRVDGGGGRSAVKEAEA